MPNGRNNAGYSKPAALAVASLAILVAAGCQQARNDPSATGALDTGTYPNLNLKPGVANEQLSHQEMAAAKAQLNGAASSNANRNDAVPNDEAMLKRLAAQHEKEALAKIENAQ